MWMRCEVLLVWMQSEALAAIPSRSTSRSLSLSACQQGKPSGRGSETQCEGGEARWWGTKVVGNTAALRVDSS